MILLVLLILCWDKLEEVVVLCFMEEVDQEVEEVDLEEEEEHLRVEHFNLELCHRTITTTTTTTIIIKTVWEDQILEEIMHRVWLLVAYHLSKRDQLKIIKCLSNSTNLNKHMLILVKILMIIWIQHIQAYL